MVNTPGHSIGAARISSSVISFWKTDAATSAKRRLYAISDLAPWPTLRPLVAVSIRATDDKRDETLRLAPSIRAGTVRASVMLRKLAGYSRQNSVAAPCARSGG